MLATRLTRTQPREAIAWLEAAARGGSAGAAMNLGTYHAQGMLGLPKDDEECFRWYGRAAMLGDVRVAFSHHAALRVARSLVFCRRSSP